MMAACGFKPAKMRGGGMVRGPGTGTSDSIPAELPVGSYVVPADSTRRINVSNGEGALTPAQVHAVGTAALEAVREVTHKPVKAAGFAPKAKRMADGGAVSPPVDNSPMAIYNRASATYQSMTGGAATPATTPAPVATPATTPAPGMNGDDRAAATYSQMPAIAARLDAAGDGGGLHFADGGQVRRSRGFAKGYANGGPIGNIASGFRTLIARGGAGAANPQNLEARQMAGLAPPAVAVQPATAAVKSVDPNNPTGIQFADGGMVHKPQGFVKGYYAGGAVGADPNDDAQRAALVAQIPNSGWGDAASAGAGRGMVNPPVADPSAAAPAAAGFNAGAGRGAVNPPLATQTGDARPDLANTPSLGGGTGTAVDGAAGVRKFTTADGRTLYSNVAGADNDKLMSNNPGVQVVPAVGGFTPGGGAASGAQGPSIAQLQQSYDQPGVASNGSGAIILNARPFGFRTADQEPATPPNSAMTRGQVQLAIAAGQNATSRANAQTDLQGRQLMADASRYGTDAQAGTAAQQLAVKAPGEIAAAQSAQNTNAAQKAFSDALQSGDQTKIDAAEMALRGQTGHLPIRYEGSTLAPESLDRMAAQYVAGDHSVMGNLGRGAQGAQNIALFQQAVDKQTKANGLQPQDIMGNLLTFKGDQAGAVAAGKRTSQLDMAANEAGNALGLVRGYSAGVPRTQFQPLNKALNSYRTNTGDPATVALGAASNTLINAYSRAISSTGNPTVNDKQHAEALLNSAQTPEQTEAVLKVMEQEIGAAKHATQDVRQGISARAGGGQQTAGGLAPAAAASPQPAATAAAAPPHIQELQRRAQSDPALAERLRSMGY